MGPLIEYLLAYQKPGGGHICRFGTVVITIPFFPAGLEATFFVTPYFNGYASIEFWHRMSPAIVPGAFTWESSHRGMQLVVGTLGAMGIAEGHNVWVEITNSQPVTTVLTNISAIGQFFEVTDLFLIVDSEQDLQELHEVASMWGA